ncbi:MAG: hypothetical protein AAF481_16890 [Acidobacteriota bacterium]
MPRQPILVILACLAAATAVAAPEQGSDGEPATAESASGELSKKGTALVQSDDLVPALGDPDGRRPITETPWFNFYSDFAFNVYDAVLTSATAQRRDRPDPFAQGECWERLIQEDRSAWSAAVHYFAETVAGTYDFSRERTIIRARLVGIEIDLDDDDRRDLALSLLFLRAAAPAWRICAWQEQDVANRRWVADLVPLLDRHADTIGARLEELFGKAWHHKPLAVDLVETAGWAGADTVAFRGVPTHIQINSRRASYKDRAAFEMIFHEASHELVSPRRGPIAELIAKAAEEVDAPIHRSLWHGVLFVTVGEVARQILAAEGETYTPYTEANGVFGGDWKVMHQPLFDHWLPFVRGEVGREEAARNLMTALKTAMAEEKPNSG